MSTTVVIGGSPVGDGSPTVLVYESGINHLGDTDIAKKMIDVAISTGWNAVKFQTRSVDIVYSKEELAKPRESPFGNTNEALKLGLEFSKEEYDELDAYCHQHNFTWFSSCWNEEAVDLIAQYDVPCFKIASACLTNDHLLKHHRQYKKPIILSTAMSTPRQVDRAVEILGTEDLVLMHCVGTYPAKSEQLNLKVIETLKRRYNIPVGWSGHELGLATTVASVAMGANIIERHGTLDRSMYGSDQSASVEPQGMARISRDIREIEKAMGDGIKRVLPEERPAIAKLRRVDTMKLEG